MSKTYLAMKLGERLNGLNVEKLTKIAQVEYNACVVNTNKKFLFSKNCIKGKEVYPRRRHVDESAIYRHGYHSLSVCRVL